MQWRYMQHISQLLTLIINQQNIVRVSDPHFINVTALYHTVLGGIAKPTAMVLTILG